MMNTCSLHVPILRGISSMATSHMLAEVQALASAAGCSLAFEATGGVDAARRVAAGEPWDLVSLAADAMAELAAAGHVLKDSVVPLVRSSMAIAVPEGAALPSVDTEAVLHRMVRSARRIGYSTGPSGKALLALFARWQLLDALQDCLVQAPAGVPVATLLARQEVDLGFQQRSELQGVPGVQVLGDMPPGLEITTTFCGAVATVSRYPQAARRALAWLASDATDACKLRHGLLPAHV